jgi:type IV secretory pathway TraG/TraD family ATPase VirD4
MIAGGDLRTRELVRLLAQAPEAELQTYLAGTVAEARVFAASAEKMRGSILADIALRLGPYAQLRDGTASLREIIRGESPARSIYIPWTPANLTAISPLATAWIEIALREILSLPPSERRRIWLVLDEIGNLHRVSMLVPALTMGRKFGLRVVAGLQSVSQLCAIYGQDDARTLLANFRTVVVHGVAATEPQTANWASDALGQALMEEALDSHGPQGSSTSYHRVERHVVPSDALTSLRPGEAWLRLPHTDAVARLTVRTRPLRRSRHAS